MRRIPLVIALLPLRLFAGVEAGVAKIDITPPVGTPLAGYGARQGKPSTGIHDPLEARALVLSNGTEKLALVAVDHLGYDHAMVTRVRDLAASKSGVVADHIFVMSSHTHAGGGAYLAIFPELAGKFDPKIRAFYEERAADAVIAAARAMKAALIGFGSGALPGLSRFRSSWPPDGMADARPIDPELGVIRIDDAATGKPMAVLMNFAAHPTVLGADNFQFSSDYVGYARSTLERLLGGGVMALFANGAQGTVAPRPFQGKDGWQRAENMGTILGAETFKVIHMIEPRDKMDLRLVRGALQLKPQMPAGFPADRTLGDTYASEMAAVVFNDRAAFVTIPGELSSILNQQIKQRGRQFGFEKVFLLGLTNDAVGYIISEDEYRHKTYESRVSFFGPHFGSIIMNEAFQLLEKLKP
jgi:neutral ceramidase